MKLSSSKRFLERGYGFFPYIIIRRRSGIYQQIPIHRQEYNLLALEGIVISDIELSESWDYVEACKKMFHRFWKQELANDITLDMCLALNSSLAFYIDKEGKIGQAAPPSGGVLLSQKGEIIQMGGGHFVFDY